MYLMNRRDNEKIDSLFARMEEKSTAINDQVKFLADKAKQIGELGRKDIIELWKEVTLELKALGKVPKNYDAIKSKESIRVDSKHGDIFFEEPSNEPSDIVSFIKNELFKKD